MREIFGFAAGVTAAFNLNALEHLNREVGTDFDLEAFQHRAVWNPIESRIEMHLVSERPQRVTLGDEVIEFDEGEALVTEHSHKYTLEHFEALAHAAGWRVERVWMDPQHWFSIQWLVADADPQAIAASAATFGGAGIRPPRRLS